MKRGMILVVLWCLLGSGIASGAEVQVEVKAREWTFFGLPLILSDPSVSAHFGSDLTAQLVQYTGDDWEFYVPGVVEEFTQLSPGKAYFVKGAADGTVTLTGVGMESFPELGSGWQTLAVPESLSTVESLLQLFSGAGWEISKLMAYDGPWGRGWGLWDGTLFNSFSELSPERGYCVYVAAKGSAVPDLTPENKTNSLGLEMVFIEPGTFWMGSPSDEPGRDSDETRHQVTLTQGYYLAATEVTNAQYVAFLNSLAASEIEDNWFDTYSEDDASHIMETEGGYIVESGNVNYPVINVSWYGAVAFCEWLSQESGDSYRLPTEAEWEYACRAGSETAFANGAITETGSGYDPNLNAMGWYEYNDEGRESVVAQKQSNAWGLYDMHGNVREWCSDWYGDYAGLNVTDPTGPFDGSVRVLRGGCWGCGAQYCRSAFRLNRTPGLTYYYYGFRPAMALAPGQWAGEGFWVNCQ